MYAQLDRLIGKAAVKDAVEAETKVAVKSAIKAEEKAALKSAMKADAKATLKTAAKTEARAALKDAMRSESKAAVKKMAEKDLVKSETKIAREKATKEILGKDARKASVSAMEEAAKRQVAKDVEKEVVRTAGKSEAKAVSKGIAKAEVKGEKKAFSQLAAEKMESKGVKAAEEKAASKSVEEILNSRARSEWEKFSGSSVVKKQILMEDLNARKELAEALNKNPALLETYNNFIASPKFRSNVTLLRYAGNNADKMRFIYAPKNKRLWLSGKDLALEDKAGKTLIKQKATGNILRELEKGENNGFVVKIDKDADPALLDMYTLSNSKYIYKNATYYTDKFGRTSQVVIKADNTIKAAGRDATLLRKVKDYKQQYTVNGEMAHRTSRLPNDDAGHLVGDSWGGPSNGINIVPQKASFNRGGIWKSSEMMGASMAKNGHIVERTIDIKYGDNLSLRPQSFDITQKVDGQFENVNGQVMDHIHLLNE